MSDEIEESRVFVVGEPAWHGKGVRLDVAPKTVKDAMIAAKANWRVNKIQATFTNAAGEVVPVSGYSALIRDEDEKPLSVLRSRYHVIQNEDAWSVFDPLLESGAAVFESAGVLYGGAVVWGMIKFNQPLEVVPGDTCWPYMTSVNAFDGSRSNTGMLNLTRVVCKNTLQVAESEGKFLFTIRHTAGADKQIEKAKQLLQSVMKQAQATVEAYRLLAKVQVDTATLKSYFAQVLPANKEGLVSTMVLNQRAKMMELCETGRGSNIPGVRGSLWGGYNAATEWVDYERGVPKGAKSLDVKKSDRRLASIWFGDGLDLKRHALNEAMALV